MNQNFKTLFFLKKGKGYKGGPMPIYLRITIDGKRAEASVQRKFEPSKWNQKKERAQGSNVEAIQLNTFLDVLKGNLFAIQKDYALRNEPLVASEVMMKLMKSKEEKQQSLLERFKDHNEQFAKLVGIEFTKGTLKKFNSTLISLGQFIKWKYNTEDVSLTEVNHLFITDYEFFLKTFRKMQHNSAMNHIKKLKKVIRICVANESIKADPFKSFKITTRDTNRNFLLSEELGTLISKEISIARLDQVRDIFVFSCYTGLSYSDVMKLTNKEVSIGIDGEKWIFTKRIKTDTPSRIPLLPIAIDILKKYSSNPQVINSGKLLPQLSNQKLNSYLKEITDMCGFKKDLTFHCARHTFATSVTLTNGVPLETVGKMLGHKNLRTTQIYAKIIDSKVSEDMQKLRKRLFKDSVE